MIFVFVTEITIKLSDAKKIFNSTGLSWDNSQAKEFADITLKSLDIYCKYPINSHDWYKYIFLAHLKFNQGSSILTK
jgi:hypothetical protein